MDKQCLYVLNMIGGDPSKDVTLMFVDKRGKRFPISYYVDEYNENTPIDKYAKAQMELTAALTGAIRECAEEAVSHLDTNIKPFYNWERHKSISGFEGGYISNGLEQYLQ